MALDEFGGVIDEGVQLQTDEFGGVIDTASLPKSSAIAEQEAFKQQFIQQGNKSRLDQALSAIAAPTRTGAGIVKGVVDLGRRGVQGVGTLLGNASTQPGLLNKAKTLAGDVIQTSAEIGPRVAYELANSARQYLGSPEAAAQTIQSLGDLSNPIAAAMRKLVLPTAAPTSAEAQAAFENELTNRAYQQQGEQPVFEQFQRQLGLEPLGETNIDIARAAPLLIGAESIPSSIESGINAVKNLPIGDLVSRSSKLPVERIFRSALKPSKQVANRLEASTKNTIPDIYHAAPNADKLGSMPLEGFQQTVNNVKKAVGAEVDEGLKAANSELTAGDDIARELNAKADKLQKAGQPTESVQVLRDRAANFEGNVTDMESLREAVTIANRNNSPLFTRTREAANPLRGQADTIANEIISKTGGAIENKALEALKGPEGALLRKKWSDLTLIEKQSSEQLNKIINQAPPEIQSQVMSTLTSPEGLTGLFALSQGYLSGAGIVVGAAVKQWARNLNRAARDSNALITTAYDKLRANPPPLPKKALPVPTQPPPLPVAPTPPNLDEAIQKILEEEQAGSTVGYF